MTESNRPENTAQHKTADSAIEPSKLQSPLDTSVSIKNDGKKAAENDQSLINKGIVPDTKIAGEWTLAVDLRADRSVAPGNAEKLQQLKDLAEKTKNSSVTIVAQIAIEGAPGKTHGTPADPNKLERYVIRDGKITEVKDRLSAGYAEDLKDLLKYASLNAPSKKLGLIENCHGGASGGLSGVGGHVSIDQYEEAIKDGLAGSGRTKLDIVDFDACIMGNAKVMDKMKEVTDNVVGSEVNESDDLNGKQFFGTNISYTVKDLLNKPSMAGKDLAGDIVDLANKGVNDGKVDSEQGFYTGTRTLAQFDLTKLPEFQTKLDQFGKELMESEKDDKSKAAIESLVKSTQIADGENRDADLKTFTEGVSAKIKSGEIVDPDGKIAAAANALQLAQSKLIPSYHGTKRGDFDKYGGMSIFLPRPFGTPDGEDAVSNGRGRASYTIALESIDSSYGNKFAINQMNAEMQEMQKSLATKYAQEMQSLNADWKKVESSTNAESFNSAYKQMKADFANRPQIFWDDYKKAQDQGAIDAQLAQENMKLAPNWAQFTSTLYSAPH